MSTICILVYVVSKTFLETLLRIQMIWKNLLKCAGKENLDLKYLWHSGEVSSYRSKGVNAEGTRLNLIDYSAPSRIRSGLRWKRQYCHHTFL